MPELVPKVTDDQLRHIWGWLNSCPGARPLSAALEQALASARRELPDASCQHLGWSLDGNQRTCEECGVRLPDDPDREPRRVNPTFWT